MSRIGLLSGNYLSMSEDITTWYLAMTAPDQLQKKLITDRHFIVQECTDKNFEFNRFLYSSIGRLWQWTDKLSWSDSQWREYAEAENLRTWVAYRNGNPAGYFELCKEGAAIELAYFGLAERYIGQRLGGGFLSLAVEKAWDWGADRVQVNTCTLDHASALANYQARGFSIYKTEKK